MMKKFIIFFALILSMVFSYAAYIPHKNVYYGGTITVPDNVTSTFLLVSGEANTAISYGGTVILAVNVIGAANGPQSAIVTFDWTGGAYQGIVTAGVVSTPQITPLLIAGTLTIDNISMSDEGSGVLSFKVRVNTNVEEPTITLRVTAFKNFGENFFYDP